MANIKKELNDIKNAVYGKEVRGSIHDGIKKINDEVENATDLSESAKHQVESIQQQVNQLVVEGDSSVEAAQARVDADGNTFTTLKERLDTKETQFASQLADIEQRKADKSEVNYHINHLENNKADKSYVDDLFENLGQLEVKGSYDSVSDLTNAYPSGTTGLFEVGGSLYAWNGNEWVKVFDLEVIPWADFMTIQDEEWII